MEKIFTYGRNFLPLKIPLLINFYKKAYSLNNFRAVNINLLIIRARYLIKKVNLKICPIKSVEKNTRKNEAYL